MLFGLCCTRAGGAVVTEDSRDLADQPNHSVSGNQQPRVFITNIQDLRVQANHSSTDLSEVSAGPEPWSQPVGTPRVSKSKTGKPMSPRPLHRQPPNSARHVAQEAGHVKNDLTKVFRDFKGIIDDHLESLQD
jgi:hypothetical protein